jgi:hypothetical protein
MSEAFDITDDDFSNVPDTTDTADNKVTCPDCNGRYTLTKAGVIRSHNCNGVKTVTRSAGKNAGKRSKKAPPANVTKIGTAALASGIEFGVSRLVANAVPCSPSQVPAELPDADVMVGPLIKFLWPNIPARAQSVISAVCDQEDLILCALAWIDYGNKLTAWTKTAHELAQAQNAQNGNTNGIQGQAYESSNGNGYGPRLVPFQPVPASEQAL